MGTEKEATESMVGVTPGEAASKRRKLVRRGRREEEGVGGADGSSVNGRRGGEAAQEPAAADWSALPGPALYLIMEKQGSPPGALADLFSMGVVCKGWHSVFRDYKRERVLPSMPPLPLNTVTRWGDPLGATCYSFIQGRRCRRRERFITWPGNNAEFIDVSHGYFLVYYTAASNEIFLADAFAPAASPAARIGLPSAPGPPHHLRYPLMTAPPTSADCLIVLRHSSGVHYCRPADTKWTTYKFCEEDHHASYTTTGFDTQHHQQDGKPSESAANIRDLIPFHAAFLEGKVYMLADDGRMVIMDLLSPHPSFTVVEELRGLPLERGRVPRVAFLVDSVGDILFVLPDPYEGPRYLHWPRRVREFVVYRLDLPGRKWVELNDLGGRTLFLNPDGPSLSYDDASTWGGARDTIYCVRSDKRRLIEFNVKDGVTVRHTIPVEYGFAEWLIPSFCYY